MASFFRSISTKIFGIALGLLVLMVLASLWSAASIGRVNRQVETLSEALVPLALTLEDLRSEVLHEYVVLQRHGYQRRDPAACRTRVRRTARRGPTNISPGRAPPPRAARRSRWTNAASSNWRGWPR